MALDQKLREKYIKDNMDKKLEILSEEKLEINGKSYISGHSKEYIKVVFEGADTDLNQVVCGRMTGLVHEDFVICERID